VIKRAFTAIFIGSCFSFGIGLPLAAQIDDPVDALDTETDSPGLIEGDDDVGLPEGSDTPADSGLPDAGVVTPQGLIRLEVDGESRYYAPVNINETQLEGTSVPTYRLDGSGNFPNDAAVTGDEALDDAAVTTDDNQPLEGTNVEPDRDSLIIYPPADSIEDLEPEDILE
jgi:hypothetical protein